MEELGLAILGLIVGTLGTLIGAGGGFILMPLLAMIFPTAQPSAIASISLATVFFNAASGSLGYARMKRIDYRSGLVFAAASVPGAILGTLATRRIDRQTFDLLLGITVIACAVFLYVAAARRPAGSAEQGPTRLGPRRLALGAAISLAVGFISSLLGIGGGIVHVPAMVLLLGFPVHIGTATSHFVLAISALTGTLIHLINGEYHGLEFHTLALAIGSLAGAQLGARLSTRVPGPIILRVLAIALGLVGARVLVGALTPGL